MNVPLFTASTVLSLGILSALRGQPLPTPTEQMKVEAHRNDFVEVDDEFVKVKAGINAEASELLTRRDYRALDEMAARLRRDRVTSPRGGSPISWFFSGLSSLPERTPEAGWQTRVQALRDWFEHDPDSITPRIALAEGLLNYAWEARGSGWASTVTEEGWRLMSERITEARRILKAAEELHQPCPVYYASRLGLALADGTPRDQYEELFEQSIKAFPTYTNFYIKKAYYLLPRWHGEEGEWERFASAAADRIGGEDGDVLYAQIVWSMHEARFFGNILQETAVEWNRTQRGFIALCRRYPQSLCAASEYCALSGFAPTNARQLMRTLFAPLANRIDLGVWKTRENFLRDRQWAFSGP